ncbi:MAG: M14 family metallopeptidase [Eubacterium sp.]|nr:M14 family metallopeptidase [Eubacterium sp.]
MKICELYSMKSLYRDDFRIKGYQFGEGEKTLCIVGALRGNENQQLFAASRLVKKLKELEQDGKLDPGKEIMVIPCGNPYSINIHKRFWTIDNTDINRMFPGYDEGETTQRIADGLFRTAQQYQYGIQFASFYINGIFAPHVRMMETGFEDVQDARKFGLPYVLLRKTRPFDTTTLNYNWQIWDTNAFSIYTTSTDFIDQASADQAVDAIVRFLTDIGAVKKEKDEAGAHRSPELEKGSENRKKTPAGTGEQPEAPIVVRDEDLLNIRTKRAGFFMSYVTPGQAVEKGDHLADILDAYDGSVRYSMTAPEAGHILFIHFSDITYADTSVFKLVKNTKHS